MEANIDIFNTQLAQGVAYLEGNYTDLGGVMLFDTQPIFNTLLDNWETLRFVNATGYCAAYQYGTSTPTYQVDGCAPVSSYL